MTTDYARIQLLKLHPVVQGLDDAAIHEIAAAAEVIHCESGQVLCHPGEPVTSIFLVVHGRVRLDLMDVHGRVVMRRLQGRGGQVGGIAALLAEPQPFLCTAEEPSTLLRFEHSEVTSLARKHELLRENFARSIADSVKRAIFQDKAAQPSRISAFFHRSDSSRVVSRRAIERLVSLDEPVHRFSDRSAPIDGVCERSLVEDDRIVSGEEVWRQVAEWLPRGRVIFDFGMDVEYARASRALEACEQVFWCVTPENWEDAVNPLRRLEARSAALRDKVCLVWLMEGGQFAPIAGELRLLASRDIKVRLGMPDSRLGPATLAGIERLVHRMRGVQIGVALGGGAARGMAHLGVLRALEQSGITIDMIAGTSAGAMTGTVYSAGFASDFLVERFAADLHPPWLFRRLPRGEQWYLLYKFRTGQFEPMLRKYLGTAHLEQFHVPMHTVAVDLISGKEVVRRTGDAVDGILESINLPLLSVPINRDGQALVDGGLINNVPANVLAARGCNFIIAVSVTAKMEWIFAQNRSDTPVDRMRRASTIQTLLRSFLVQSHSVNAMGVQPADFKIEPDVTTFDLSSFGRTRELASIGENAALAAAQQIMSLLNHLDPGLFPRTTNQLASGGTVTTPVLSPAAP